MSSKAGLYLSSQNKTDLGQFQVWYKTICTLAGGVETGSMSCSMFKSFLVISANVPCTYYVQPEAASERTNRSTCIVMMLKFWTCSV